jgi:small subunit ribosomal protein S17
MSTATDSKTRKPLQSSKTGEVVSDKADKTIKVVVQYLRKAPKYGKYIRRRSTFQVHDANNDAKIGDLVEIVPCRPISKTKSWRLVKVTRRAPGNEEGAASE